MASINLKNLDELFSSPSCNKGKKFLDKYSSILYLLDVDEIILGTGLETTTGTTALEMFELHQGSVSGKATFSIKDALSCKVEGISTIFVIHYPKYSIILCRYAMKP